MPLKILYVIDALHRGGGTENQLAGLVRRWDPAAVGAHVCNLHRPHEAADTGAAPVLTLDCRGLAHPATWREARRVRDYIVREGIQIVQTFFQDATVFGLWTARLAGVRHRVASFRDLGFWREPRIQFLMRRSYPQATAFLANSQAVKDRFVADDNLDPGRITVIHNGLDPEAIPFSPERGDPPTVVLLGNFNRPVKRADLFVEAALTVAGRMSDVRFLLIGDGEQRTALEGRVAETGLADRFDFVGRRRDVPELLAGCAVGVNCSDSEGFSNAILEYMLAGCAVVATEIGGNAELVRHGVDGLLVPCGDAPALAAAMEQMLAEETRRRTFAEAARERVAREFSWDCCLERHRAFYDGLLATRPTIE